MELVYIIAFLGLVFGAFGAWVAVQKGRDVSEGMILGFLFGPLGVPVVALLPARAHQAAVATPGTPRRRHIDDQGTIAEIAERFRCALENADPLWVQLPHRRQKAILKSVEKQIISDLKLTPTTFADFAAEARRMVLGPMS